MDESRFKLLIKKYQRGLLSEKEQALLDKWFEALGKDRHPVNWSETDKAELKQKILSEIQDMPTRGVFVGVSKGGGQSPSRRSLHFALRTAAAVLLLAACSYGVWQLAASKSGGIVPVLEARSDSGINKVLLADGSIVWLKPGSALTYPEEFTGSERRVSLQGEALFEVAKDPSHRFVIECGELTTTVLGTSFNIKASDKDVEVIVLTGKVSLTSANDGKGIVLLPNERAVYNMQVKQIAKVVQETEDKADVIEAVSSGTEYKMSFEDTRLAEVIRRIEQKFDVTVETLDPKVRNCMITANFTGESLERTMSMITQALGIDYEMKDRTIIVRGGGCN